MTRDSPVIELAGLDVHLGRIPVLRSVDLRVDAGDVVGVVGHNGSGKSTVLRVMATLVKPTAGSAHLFGVEVSADQMPGMRRRVALSGHHPSLWGELTLLENLMFVGRISGAGTSQVEAALELLGLEGAMRRRADTGVTFAIVDDGSTVNVRQIGTPPRLFQDEVGVVVEGTSAGDWLAVDTLIIRHDEEYRSSDDEAPSTPASESSRSETP